MAIGDWTVIFEPVNPAINFIPTGTNKFMCTAFGGRTNCYLAYENAAGAQDLLYATSNNGSVQMAPLVSCKFVFSNLLYARMTTTAGAPPYQVAYSFVQVE
jgi:hypothetical protein